MRFASFALCVAACGEASVLPDASTPDVSLVAELSLEPDTLLDFGDVPAASEAVREVSVRNTGGEALVIDSVRLASGNEEKWRFEASPSLFDGLAPGESARLTVAFRPCPEGWVDAAIDPSFDFSICNERVAAGGIEIESNAGRFTLSLAGRGAGPPPQIAVLPQDGLRFQWSASVPSVAALLVSNRGGSELVIHEIVLEPIGQLNFHGEFTSAELCAFDSPTCRNPIYLAQVTFFPITTTEAEATVVIRSNDPVTPELRVPLLAVPSECASPTAVIDRSEFSGRTGETISLTARYSMGSPSGGSLSSYEWSWIRTPTTAPALSANDRIDVMFVVDVSGTYVIGLETKNECGARSPGASPEILELYDP